MTFRDIPLPLDGNATAVERQDVRSQIGANLSDARIKVNCRLPIDDFNLLQEKADERGMTVWAYLREIVHEGLRR